MLAKLFKGELSLATTFWKYGILGLIILHYGFGMIAAFLNSHLKGRTILEFFLHHFNFFYSDKLSLWWVLCYMAAFVIFVVYSYRIIVAVWRSAKSYSKSIWLEQLARLGIILAVVLAWYPFVVR